MAAATGYDDGPTDEQLCAYRDLPVYGMEMAEVFAVRVPAAAGGSKPSPCGKISFGGGHGFMRFIYSRSRPDKTTFPQPCDSQGNIVLTGPSVVISAYGPVYLSLHLHDGSQDPSSQEGKVTSPATICCENMEGHFSSYDRPILETVNTGYGPADVIYAVLSNGVEGQVTVKLARWDGEDHTGIFGRIVARSKLFDVGCVLFYNEHDKNIRAGSEELIPLARYALAVPLHVPLTIELDLHCYSGDEIIRGSLQFNPAVNGQQVNRLVGMSGTEIEVTISWLDFPW